MYKEKPIDTMSKSILKHKVEQINIDEIYVQRGDWGDYGDDDDVETPKQTIINLSQIPRNSTSHETNVTICQHVCQK